MALDGLRARLDQMLAALARGTDTRASASGLYEALVETKAALAGLKQSLVGTDRELGTERQHLADAERRGQMAAGIADRETADLAAIWGKLNKYGPAIARLHLARGRRWPLIPSAAS